MEYRSDTSRLIEECLRLNPDVTTKEITHYVYQKQGRPQPKYLLSGTMVGKVKEKLGLSKKKTKSSLSTSSQLIEECLRQNPEATYKEITRYVYQKQGKPEDSRLLGSTLVGKVKKKLGMIVGEKTQHGRDTYLKIGGIPLNKEYKSFELTEILVNFINETRKMKLQVVELANPKELEIREVARL